jgi:xanthine dehydrogenase accessory factor
VKNGVALPAQMSVEGGKALAANVPANPLTPPLAA